MQRRATTTRRPGARPYPRHTHSRRIAPSIWADLSFRQGQQVFRPTDGSPALVGVVGQLRLDVLRARLANEYGLEIDWSTAEFQFARWIAADDRTMLDRFVTTYRSAIAEDFDGDLVFLVRNAFDLEYTGEKNTDISFTDVKDIHRRKSDR
jgi:peptide chain release factor 3